MSLAIHGLGRRFGDFRLHGISLRVLPGQYLVLLGPSGCGKSLLLHTIAGLHLPDDGRVELDGRDMTQAPPEARQVGLCFQRGALFPHLTVTGNIEYGLRVRRVPVDERRRRVDELVESLRLHEVVARPVATLSGGEAQRVAIARALAIRPRLLLLDEPLSLVDHNARLALQAELGRLHRELGLTTVHVTHSREEALALGDQCAVMLGGTLVQQGPTADVFARPRCAYVARFLGLEDKSVVDAPDCGATCTRQPGSCDRPDGGPGKGG